MASSENVEIVRRIHQAVESGGMEVGAAFAHEDFEMTMMPEWSEAAIFRGWEEALRAIRDFASSFDEFRGLPEQVTAAGADLVVVDYHEWAKPRGGSIEIEHLFGILYTLREGKIARMEWFNSPAEAMHAAAERSADLGLTPGTSA
jgi:ketosteroid isomerase-like protein